MIFCSKREKSVDQMNLCFFFSFSQLIKQPRSVQIGVTAMQIVMDLQL